MEMEAQFAPIMMRWQQQCEWLQIMDKANGITTILLDAIPD